MLSEAAEIKAKEILKQETYAKRNAEILDTFCHGSHDLR